MTAEREKDLFTGRGGGPSPFSPPESPLHILLLEDDPADAELIERQLQVAEQAFVVQRVDTWQSFVRELGTFTPTVILSDFSLPGFSGLEALRHIHTQGLRLPFILVTGSQPEEVAVQCMKEGADDYILKSSLQRLPGAIFNAIEKHAHERRKEKAEADLRQQRDTYETLLNAQSDAGVGFAVVSARSRKPLHVNDALCRISGYAAGELLTLPSFLHLASPDTVDRFEARLRTRNPGTIGADTMEAALVNKHGERVEVEVTVKQPRMDRDTPFIVIVRDISDRMRHENQLKATLGTLREREEQFRLLFEGVKEYAIFVIDLMGQVVNWNTAAERMYGYTAEEVAGKHFSLFSPEGTSHTASMQSSLTLAREKGKLEEEGWRVRKDGSRFWAGVIISPMYNDEKTLVGFSTVIRDLTDRKNVEDQLRRQGDDLRALTRHLQFVREEERFRISRELHDELGQVLTALRMDLSILQRRIVKGGEQVNQGPLIEKITSMSQLVETTIHSVRRIVMELRPTVLDEFGLMTAIQWQAQEFETRTGIRCIVTRLQRDVDVDPNQATTLFRMLQEALTNVARHANAKQVRVSVEAQGGNFILTIEDNGTGIDPARIAGSTSFGLLGMQERARILGGRVDIQGIPGKGTTIVIRIPMKWSSEGGPAGQS